MAELQAMRPQATVGVGAGSTSRAPQLAAAPPAKSSAERVEAEEQATARPAEAGADAAVDAPAAKAKPVAMQSEAAGLHPHPDPALIQQGKIGPLPVIGPDGRQSWQVYARPFSTLDERPRIALVITRMGISASATESAIQNLPGPITLAFAPFARRLDEWINRARGSGHEVLINLPMEPLDYPRSDPGPYALLTSISSDQNLRRLEWVLSRVTGYVGVTNFMGAKFMTSEAALRPVLEELKKRGLMFLDGHDNPQAVVRKLAAGLRLPHAVGDVVIDSEPSRAAVDSGLAELEKIARARGTAVGIGRPYPVTLERVRRWSQEIAEKGIVLTPVSAIPGQAANR